MSDPSAGRPSTPEEPKSFTEEDVEMLVQVAGARLLAMTGLAELPASRALLMSHEMRAVLSALAAAGRLLPASSEHLREQFGVMGDDPIREKVTGMPKASREAAEEEITDHLADLAPGEKDRWNLRLGHRWLTPWTEVDRSPTDA